MNRVRVHAWTIMPTHLHLLADFPREISSHSHWRRILNLFPFESGGSWESIPEPSLIEGKQKLAREVRYIHLNPCRDRLISDPLEWEWSSYREILVLSLNRLSDAHLWQGTRLRELHQYTSADPSCRVEGTPYPQLLFDPTEAPHLSIDQWKRAVLLATRGLPQEFARQRTLARRLLIEALRWDGRFQTDAIAKKVGWSIRTARKTLRNRSLVTSPPPSKALRTLVLLSQDARLMKSENME